MIKTLVKPLISTNDNIDLEVLIFKTKFSDVKILEKPMIDWVKDCVLNYKTTIQNFNEKKNELEQIKMFKPKSRFLLVLYSFNPLLTKNNIDLCVDYLVLKGEKMVKLPFGYIFETEYLKTLTQIKEPLMFSADGSEFLKIESEQEVGYAAEVLQRRIITNFINMGVKFINPQNIVINAYVKLQKGAVIYPFNTLSGNTIVCEGATLKEGNTIINSEIGKNAVVANSVIKDSTICSNCIVFPFNTIENNTFVGANSTIKSYNKINNSYIGENSTIESFNDIGK